MEERDINPYIRFCSEVNLYTPYQELLKAYDHRLFYVISGGFTAHFENGKADVRSGGVLIMPPATAYRLEPLEFGKSKHVIINYDLEQSRYGTPTKTLSPINAFSEDEIYSVKTVKPFDRAFILDGAFFCADPIRRMCEELKEKRTGYDSVLSSELKALLVRIRREYEKRKVDTCDGASVLCEQVKEYIRGAYSERITNVDIAGRFGYHPYYLNSVFRGKTGMTVHAFLLEVRLTRARELLLSSEKTVAEIGLECGFSGASYFSEAFLKNVGMTPREYRGNVK